MPPKHAEARHKKEECCGRILDRDHLEKLKVKIEVFVSLEKVRNHCVGRMRTHTEKALNRGHFVGERACLEACKTESTSVGYLIENFAF